MRDLFIFLAILTFFTTGCAQKASEPVIIDETHLTESIVQTLKIDSVWAGHPVGFCMYTHGERQYVAYYNANRNMVVGQRNLDDDSFQLHVMQATTRAETGGTSTVLGWDSHNSVTLGIDKKGFIHLSGNMHVHPITYFTSSKPNDISTLVQEMTMVGPNEKRCTYPHFMLTKDDELIATAIWVRNLVKECSRYDFKFETFDVKHCTHSYYDILQHIGFYDYYLTSEDYEY